MQKNVTESTKERLKELGARGCPEGTRDRGDQRCPADRITSRC